MFLEVPRLDNQTDLLDIDGVQSSRHQQQQKHQ